MTDDQVRQVLDEIVAMWLVDEDPIRWLDPAKDGASGFDWWPGQFCVRVRAHRHADPVIDASIRIAIETDLLRGVGLASEEFQTKVDLLARIDTSTFAWVYVPEPVWEIANDPTVEKKLTLSNTGHVSPETIGWMPRLLAYAVISQAIYAQIQVSALAKLLGSGIPDATRLPLQDARPLARFAEIAEYVRQMGNAASRFAGTGEFEAFRRRWSTREGFSAHAGQTRLLLRAPFGEDSAYIQFLTDEKHERLGHGLAVTLRLPISGQLPAAVEEAAYLNFMESRFWTGFSFLGCWQTSEKDGQFSPEFSLFVPNALYFPGLVGNIAYWFMARAGWFRMLKSPARRAIPNPREP
jgi:hypothetical protein